MRVAVKAKPVAASSGIGFGGLLAILFIGLKLGHVIDWSWWWVLAPLWLPIVAVFGTLGVVFLFAVIVVAMDRH